MEKETYTTIENYTLFEIEKIKGSRFIGRIFPVKTRSEADEEIAKLRKEFYTANHHCFAYKLGLGDREITRYSDDGEPTGTAGKPIFNVLEGSGVTDVLVVITRFFGGTKLGTGGLIKAYTESSKAVFEHADVSVIELKEELKFRYDYDSTSLVMNIVSSYEAKIISEEYGNDAYITILINRAFIKNFCEELYDRSNGTIEVEKPE